MAENTKGQNLENANSDTTSNGDQRSGASRQNVSTEKDTSTGLDEKSSTMGRNAKHTGISTKDGVTGSDYDGQVTDR